MYIWSILNPHGVGYALSVAPVLESVPPSAAIVGSVVEVFGLCFVTFGFKKFQ